MRRAATLAVFVVLPFGAGCDAVQDAAPTAAHAGVRSAPLTAAERAARARYVPEPTTTDARPGGDDFALRFGRGQSAFTEPLAVIQDQTFRVALDVYPDAERGAVLDGRSQALLASRDRLRLLVLPGGALRFTTPGYIGGAVGTWTLTTPPGAVRAKRWQRVEASYNELMLRIAVDGVVLAETDRYQESGTAGSGRAWLAPSFAGAVDAPRFATYEGTEVYNAATFDEGRGDTARFTGLSGGKRELRRAVWTPRSTADHDS